MNARELRCGDNGFCIQLAEAANILGNGAVKQFNILRQVTNVWAECGAIPLRNVRAVQPDFAGENWPDT